MKKELQITELSGGPALNGSPEGTRVGIIHSAGEYWISNEGNAKKPAYHVWKDGLTHSSCDSAYDEITLAISRCNYLANIT